MPVTDAAGQQAILSRGYAQVHEDDTERAMRPGLELVVTVAGLNALVPSQTRVGTAQGFCCHGRADRSITSRIFRTFGTDGFFIQ